MPVDDVDFDDLARRSIGYTGADLEALCKEAALKALKPHMPRLKEFTTDIPSDVLDNLTVTMDHFNSALPGIDPSAMREVLIQRPHVTWDDIGGLDDEKRKLREAVQLPLQQPHLFEQAGITAPKGILLHGPPGTGKTLLAKAVANEANANFIAVKGPELVSKWVGESEQRVREIFKRAKQVAPTVIFFDEFDSITKVRGQSLTDSTERMVNQLLTEIDGVEDLEQVTVIAATNRPDLIDPALLRAGRIETKLEVQRPDSDARREIFRVHTRDMPLGDVNLDTFIDRTDGWTGADIMALCREAGMNAIRDATANDSDDVAVTTTHFDDAFSDVEPTDQPSKIIESASAPKASSSS
jgi:transitional endoplasmic reticulum ATPase